VKITKKEIFTRDSSFSRKSGWATKPPTAYFIKFWEGKKGGKSAK
jgi:hypothetical protein